MAVPTSCDFLKSVKRKRDILVSFCTSIASEYVLEDKRRTTPREYFEDKMDRSGLELEKDERELVFIDFMNLINTPGPELEALYLKSIFDLEDDDAMLEQLVDFSNNAII